MVGERWRGEGHYACRRGERRGHGGRKMERGGSAAPE